MYCMCCGGRGMCGGMSGHIIGYPVGAWLCGGGCGYDGCGVPINKNENFH